MIAVTTLAVLKWYQEWGLTKPKKGRPPMLEPLSKPQVEPVGLQISLIQELTNSMANKDSNLTKEIPSTSETPNK